MKHQSNNPYQKKKMSFPRRVGYFFEKHGKIRASLEFIVILWLVILVFPYTPNHPKKSFTKIEGTQVNINQPTLNDVFDKAVVNKLFVSKGHIKLGNKEKVRFHILLSDPAKNVVLYKNGKEFKRMKIKKNEDNQYFIEVKLMSDKKKTDTFICEYDEKSSNPVEISFS